MNMAFASDSYFSSARTGRSFAYRHTISFEETNVVGNVYFTRHISWQGRCRELFLKQYAPDIVDELGRDLRLVTLSVHCDYFAELRALEEVEIRMSLEHLRQHRIGLSFAYAVQRDSLDISAARGFQEIGCMQDTGRGLVPRSVPEQLARALDAFR